MFSKSNNSNATPILVTAAWQLVKNIATVALFQHLTKPALPMFLRGCDIISSAPLTLGTHEPQLVSLLNNYANQGYIDFLIDIGANIGLTSCQSGLLFKKVVMFEPNPLCIGVLQSNTSLMLDQVPHEIHNFGLGIRDETLTLRIPKHNWGGAYVVTRENTYSANTLMQKDGFTHDDPANYLTRDIKIRNAADALAKVFDELTLSGAARGIIKIDVEGLESVVLNAIAESVPASLELVVVFEHWGSTFEPTALLESFGGRAQLFSLIKSPSGGSSVLGKLLRILRQGDQRFELSPWSSGDQANDFVLEVASEHNTKRQCLRPG